MGIPGSTNYMQHEYMFKNWVNASRDLLLSMFGNTLSVSDATGLALGGMNDVLQSNLNPSDASAFKSYFNTFAINNYGMTLFDAALIRVLYNPQVAGAVPKGTAKPCL